MAQTLGDDLAQIVERILEVDRGRSSNDLFKLPVMLHALVETRLMNFRTALQNQQAASGNRSGNSELAKEAFTRLEERLRDGFRFLTALPSFRVPQDKKRSALLTYGWVGGKIGSLQSKDRMLKLARLAISATPLVLPVEARYPADLLLELQKELDILQEAEPGAQVGSRSAATKAKYAALQDLSRVISRVRGYYVSASDDIDRTPELARLGLNPRRALGQRRIPAEQATVPAP